MQENNNLLNKDNFVWSIVHKLLSQLNGRYYYSGLEDDLFQEGYVGLLTACDKFDKSSGIQFSTFAYKYIYGYCLNYLKKECQFLNSEDIDDSPRISNESYELDTSYKIDLIEEINKKLRVTKQKISEQEEQILKDRLLKEYSLQKCAELNHCSTKKITNVVEKYKNLIKEILIN